MKNKNGFTLVELLAVIVILAIIMIISIPAVLDTMQVAKEKTFAEYVSKVYDTAEKKYLEQELTEGVEEYVRYDIKNDLGLTNTGEFKGYVVFIRGTDKTDVYIGLSDNDYHTITQWGTNESERVNYINYTLGGEPKYTSNPEVFNGKTNYFMRGSTDDFNLPSKEELQEAMDAGATSLVDALSGSGFTSLTEESISTDKMFINSANDFLRKAKARYLSERDSSSKISREEVYNDDFQLNGTKYIAAYTVNDIYGASSSNKGYIVFIEDYYPNTLLGVPIKERQTYIAFKDQNYHTVLKVEGFSHSKNKLITEKFPLVQLNELLHDFSSLSFKKIETAPPTYDLTQGYKNLVASENFAAAEASGDIQRIYEAYSNINEKLMNTQQYYCANSNTNCSFGAEYDKIFYEDPSVLLGSYFDMNLDIDWSQF